MSPTGPTALFRQGTEASLPALADFPSQLYWAYNTGRQFIADGSRVWQRTNIAFKGAYNGSTTYQKLDAVTYNGSTWLALRTVTGVTPVEGADWTVLAAKGDTGAPGGVTSFGPSGSPRTGVVLPASGDYNAGQITNTPAGNIASSTLQGAVNELDTEKMPFSGGTFTGAVLLSGDATQALNPVSLQQSQTNAFKNRARAATTANITLSGTQTVDTVALVAGDRALVKNQTTASQNGLYDVASGTWTRTSDADTSAKVAGGLSVRVSEGTQAGQIWYLSTTGTIALGTTALTFAQSGAAGGGISLLLDTQLTTDLWPGSTLTGGTWNNVIAGASVTKVFPSSNILVIATGMAITTSITTPWSSGVAIASTSNRKLLGGGGYAASGGSIIPMSGTALFLGLAAGSYQFLLQVQPKANAVIFLRAATETPFEHARLIVLEVA